MRPSGFAGRVFRTRSGRYAVAVVPLPHSPLPGFRASLVQAVRVDDRTRALRLTLYERLPAAPDPNDGPRAA